MKLSEVRASFDTMGMNGRQARVCGCGLPDQAGAAAGQGAMESRMRATHPPCHLILDSCAAAAVAFVRRSRCLLAHYTMGRKSHPRNGPQRRSMYVVSL